MTRILMRKARDARLIGHLALALALAASGAAEAAGGAGADPPARDTELARSVGADAHGMRGYVLVVLKTGPTRVPDGAERDAMFKGHFANIERLAGAGTLVLAGPLDGVDGWRGLFVLAVADIDEARREVATDPVIANGEMVAEYHTFYGSGALMLMNDLHKRLAPKRP